jgi:hypothetical protein
MFDMRSEVAHVIDRVIGWQEPSYRTIVAVDIEGFGHPSRDDPVRMVLRKTLGDQLTWALDRAGIDLGLSERFDTGDGCFMVLDPRVSKARLLDAAVWFLPTTLGRWNRQVADPARIRLRVAVNAGELLRDVSGWAGEALNTTFRLLDAGVVKAALKASSVPLVLVVADAVYQGIVRHGHGSSDPGAYVPVGVAEKETDATAWLCLPGQPAGATGMLVRGGATGPYAAAAGTVPVADRGAAAAPAVVTQVTGDARVGSMQVYGEVRGDVTVHLGGEPPDPGAFHG